MLCWLLLRSVATSHVANIKQIVQEARVTYGKGTTGLEGPLQLLAIPLWSIKSETLSS